MSQRSIPVDDTLTALQQPGSGLPILELWAARAIVWWRSRRINRAEVDQLFLSEKKRIDELVETIGSERASHRVLIDRLRGMEDSSRNWSVFMTLDHLRIVNRGILSVINSLSSGELPTRIVGTADVKPNPAVDATIVVAFEAGCAEFQHEVASLPELHTTLRWPHPWFGPLNAAQWHFVAAFHMGLHRKQIEEIVRLLPCT